MNRPPLVQDILNALLQRFDRPIMNNVHRSEYVECMVQAALDPDWQLTWMLEAEWAGWDLEHTGTGARLEVKQSADRQTWDREPIAPRRSPQFDIAARTGYWTNGGSRWVGIPGRPADLYVFAWHPGRSEGPTDHRDPGQWEFFVVREPDLPSNQKRIGLSGLREIASPCRYPDLRSAVDRACPVSDELKSALEGQGA